ncbi:phage pre-tape measure protein [Roseibium sediminis]|uniref:phage pre-tape measure protein n=1 Tax=Roseibium sediminis TaxID=1775174 RepID=UPI00123E2A61|nr:hypothetical protein [Roseibium sediminis]
MPLQYTPITERITFGGDNFIELRGLNEQDLTSLFRAHQETVTDLFDRFVGRSPDTITEDDVDGLALKLAVAFPAIVNHVIAASADVPNQVDEVGKLPLDVKVASLEKIATLTFAMSGGAKNFVEMVTRMGEGMTHLVEQVSSHLPTLKNGSMASEDKSVS